MARPTAGQLPTALHLEHRPGDDAWGVTLTYTGTAPSAPTAGLVDSSGAAVAGVTLNAAVAGQVVTLTLTGTPPVGRHAWFLEDQGLTHLAGDFTVTYQPRRAASATSVAVEVATGTTVTVESAPSALGLAAHISDPDGAHPASAVSVMDSAGNYGSSDVESALAEIAGQTGDRSVVAGTVGRVDITSGHASNAIASDIEAGTILGGGQDNSENVIGASSVANVNTASSNLPTATGTGANYSVITGGYDNVANGLMSVVSGAHNYTTSTSTHGTISGGSIHKITAGDYGVIAGGNQNTVSARSGTVGGGEQNTVSGAGGFVAGGSINTASGQNASVIGGSGNTSSGSYGGIVGGGNNTASGDFSAVVSGERNTASDWHATALGQYADTRLPSSIALGGGRFAANGDAQSHIVTLKRQTTSASADELRAGYPTERLVLPNDTTWAFEALVVARRADANDESAAWRIQGCIDRNAAANTTALVGTPTVTTLGDDSAGSWSVIASADTVNGALKLAVTGAAGKTVNWVAQLRLAEVTG